MGWGRMIENLSEWSKFGQILNEFGRFRTIYCESEKCFFKIVNRVGEGDLINQNT